VAGTDLLSGGEHIYRLVETPRKQEKFSTAENFFEPRCYKSA